VGGERRAGVASAPRNSRRCCDRYETSGANGHAIGARLLRLTPLSANSVDAFSAALGMCTHPQPSPAGLGHAQCPRGAAQGLVSFRPGFMLIAHTLTLRTRCIIQGSIRDRSRPSGIPRQGVATGSRTDRRKLRKTRRKLGESGVCTSGCPLRLRPRGRKTVLHGQDRCRSIRRNPRRSGC
jgi:hypothetical protein